MHSVIPQPPPPAVLWEDSLGLVLKALGEGNLSGRTDPVERGVVENCGDSGAIDGAEVIGVPMAAGGGAVVVDCGAAGAVSFGAPFDD
jgi:hypothetical protein